MNEHYPFSLPVLPYTYDALAPSIDARTLEAHHEKLLGASVDALNRALAPYPQLHTRSLEELIEGSSALPSAARDTIWQNASILYAHTLFFNSMTEAGRGGMPTGMLAGAMRRAFGTIEDFEAIVRAAALRTDGGFVWLCADREGEVRVLAMPESIVPLPLYPLLCLDLWEHSYAMQYGEELGAYIESWFALINWDAVSARYSAVYATLPPYPIF